GGDRQLARLFIERGRDRQHDVVIGERRALALLPGQADLLEKAGRGLDRGKHTTALGYVVGQDLGGSVHVWVREPALGRVNQARRNQCSLLAREHAHRLVTFQKK